MLPHLRSHPFHTCSHTYHRVGRWKDAVESNVHALEIDTRDAKRCVGSVGGVAQGMEDEGVQVRKHAVESNVLALEIDTRDAKRLGRRRKV